MTPDQQRKILEAAANAMGYPIDDGRYDNGWWIYIDSSGEPPNDSAWSELWNPLIDSADTASMCARVDINTIWHFDKIVECADQWRSIYHAVPHDGTDAGKEAAWRLAATMVAAKVGGYSIRWRDNMTYDDWWEQFKDDHEEWRYADSNALRKAAYEAGAASRDAEIAELVAALEDNWNCNPCETTRQQKAFDVAQSVLVKVRNP